MVVGHAMAEDRPFSSDTPQLEDGKRVYRQYCASCHGTQGEGMPNWEEQNALAWISHSTSASTALRL